jgi:ribosomal protein L32
MPGYQALMRIQQRRQGDQLIMPHRMKCDACGTRFVSGSIQVKRGKVVALRCHKCVSKGTEPLNLMIDRMAEEMGRSPSRRLNRL